jgi:hypothetical protein
MVWNNKHINKVDYPDNPELQQALDNFREQYSWYETQLKCRKFGVNYLPVQDAWNQFSTLRNQYGNNSRSSNSSARKGHGSS